MLRDRRGVTVLMSKEGREWRTVTPHPPQQHNVSPNNHPKITEVTTPQPHKTTQSNKLPPPTPVTRPQAQQQTPA
ncbi:hypothetical protein Pmani_032274 [Petrolisthes manimaculis]|uniref:Uncharacterized protein n=1 Tax=Petrolisthes manimaculis TaxID=1843537 RepID=A0AAE1NS11_9EUCA|nr:hypothetical protein Pmani_032274 [Petrolisthes manimaculis]